MYDTNNFYILRVILGGATIIDIATSREEAIDKVKELQARNTNNKIVYCYLDDNEIY